jgi:RNA polymerase sigma factor (sigma-70 family)
VTDSLLTRPSLLIRIRDPKDDAAWRQFVRLYAPLVYGFARRRGLQDADAADLVQDVLQQAATGANRFDYDRECGTFRSWLFRVIRNRLSNWFRRQRPHEHGAGDSAVQAILELAPSPESDAAEWDTDYDRRLFDFAAEQVRDEFEAPSWAAFWQTAVDGHTPKDVARRLGVSVGAVYVAKSRVLARLRQKILEMEE